MYGVGNRQGLARFPVTPSPLLNNSLLNVADTEEGKEEGGYWIRQITTFVLGCCCFSCYLHGHQCALGDFLLGHMSKLFRGLFPPSVHSHPVFCPLSESLSLGLMLSEPCHLAGRHNEWVMADR